MIALDSQYEPLLGEEQGDRCLDEATQRRQLMEREISEGGRGEPPTDNAVLYAAATAKKMSGEVTAGGHGIRSALAKPL